MNVGDGVSFYQKVSGGKKKLEKSQTAFFFPWESLWFELVINV